MRDKLIELATDEKGQLYADFTRDDRGQIGTIITVVTIGIVAIIGILIFGQVDQMMPETQSTELQNATDGVEGGFADAMQLLPVVMIVFVASLVIGVVQRFGGR